MTTAHTPGPWIYRCGDEWSHSVVTKHGGLPSGEPNFWTICSINSKRDEVEANACLIAAAPDLLEALEIAKRQLELSDERFYDSTTMPVIDAALALAKGQP